jgi:uncharacterized protein YqgV (UPF0045/DUF77 family)
MRLIGQAHTLVHQGGVARVQTDIRVGTRYVLLDLKFGKNNYLFGNNRTDKKQHFSEKVTKVQSLLKADEAATHAGTQ